MLTACKGRGGISNTRLQLIVVGGGMGITVVLYWLLDLDHGFPSWFRLPIGIAIDALVDATVKAVPWLFSGIRSAVVVGVDSAEHVLVATSPLVIAAVTVIVVAKLASVRLAVFSLAGITFIGATGLWEATMETAALMVRRSRVLHPLRSSRRPSSGAKRSVHAGSPTGARCHAVLPLVRLLHSVLDHFRDRCTVGGPNHNNLLHAPCYPANQLWPAPSSTGGRRGSAGIRC